MTSVYRKKLGILVFILDPVMLCLVTEVDVSSPIV